jgi:type I restriction enzyme S subunit
MRNSAKQWPHIPLGELAEIERNAVSPENIKSGTKYVGLENMTSSGSFVGVAEVATGDLASTKFAFTDRHILYGKLRPYLAKIARPRFPGVCSTDILPILPGSKVDPGFLLHFLRQPRMVDYASSKTTGANLPRLSPKALAEFEIPLPPLSEQKRIADILDKADSIRRKRQEALTFRNQFLQSTFLEMFGDPATNSNNLPLRELSEFYVNPKDGTKCGPFGGALKKEEYVPAGVPVWNMDNIADDGRLVPNIRLWISKEKYEDLSSYSVKDGDIIISRAGTVGKMCVVRAGLKESIISTNLIRLRLNSLLIPEFFVSLMVFFKGRAGRLKTGPDGAFTHMSTGVLDKLTFPCPSVGAQRDFVSIMEQMDCSTHRLTMAVNEVSGLFNSLVQRAFKGEL